MADGQTAALVILSGRCAVSFSMTVRTFVIRHSNLFRHFGFVIRH
jgi:hypothetical protein